MTLNCKTCVNSVGDSFCTMNKNMEVAKYKKCDGFKTLPPKPKREKYIPKKRIIGVMGDEHFSSEFMKFVKKGGGYSFRTNSILKPGEE